MRKLAANCMALVLLSFFVLVGSASTCDGSSPCERACVRFNSLGCGTTCDCTACEQAPDECESYFYCVDAHAHSCPEFDTCAAQYSGCKSFTAAHCH